MMRRHNVLGVEVCATDYAQACEVIRLAALERRSLAVTALAVHGVMTGALNRAHCRRLNALDMVLPDGQPVRWALNGLYGEELRDRVCGPTLMLHVCEMAARCGLSVGFYGNKASVLAVLRQKLQARFPGLKVSLEMPSRFGRVGEAEQAELASRIARSETDILFVGLGCPRQEVWVYENRGRLDMPILAVGAALDFHADRMPRAPAWMSRAGLEWIFRLWHEPRRLWRRYLLLNPLYLTMLAGQKLGLRRPARAQEDPVPFEGFA